MTKSELRSHQRRLLSDAVASGQIQQWNESVIGHLRHWISSLHQPSVIALFGGLPNEPDLWLHLAPTLLAGGHTPALFLTDSPSHTMRLFAVTAARQVVRAPLGYWEPSTEHAEHFAPVHPDLVLIPRLAFCPLTGSRLGRGAGYYDRYLASPGMTRQLIGVGYECQLIDSLPADPHDLPVHRLCTELGWKDIPTPS